MAGPSNIIEPLSPLPAIFESGAGVWPGKWNEKSWGRCRTIYRDAQVEIVEAEIVAGGFSSVHKHLAKDNTFIVVEGELEISLYPASLRPTKYILTSSTSPLEPHSLTVDPFIPHKFLALQACRVIEIYRAKFGKVVDPEDICRFGEGGVRK